MCCCLVSIILRLALERQRYMQGWIANHDLLNRTNSMVMQDHSLLRILGIEPDELIKDGVTPDELMPVWTRVMPFIGSVESATQ
jgi:hypothetical protein